MESCQKGDLSSVKRELELVPVNSIGAHFCPRSLLTQAPHISTLAPLSPGGTLGKACVSTVTETVASAISKGLVLKRSSEYF